MANDFTDGEGDEVDGAVEVEGGVVRPRSGESKILPAMGWGTWRWTPTSRGQIKELRTMTWDRTTETKVHEGT